MARISTNSAFCVPPFVGVFWVLLGGISCGGNSPAAHSWNEVFTQVDVHRIAPATLSVSIAFPELFSEEQNALLASGFPTEVVTHCSLFTDHRDVAISQQIVVARADYDLWEEKYLVQVIGENQANTYWLSDIDAVKAKLSRIPSIRFSVEKGDERRFKVQGVTRLNPMPVNSIARMRKWLSEPVARINESHLFGEFVALFVQSDIPLADRSIRWHTDFQRPSMESQKEGKAQ